VHANVILARVRPGGVEALSEAARASDAPDVTRMPGFVAYYVTQLDAEQYATIAIFEEKTHSDAWADAYRDYADRRELRQYLDDSEGPAVRGFSGTVIYSRP
jgi:heme-degrading monooxygenase HmoA